MSRLEFKHCYHLFYKNVIRHAKGCWGWRRSCSRNGYACVLGVKASRVSYEIQFGPIPKGLCVLHTCDNPICTKPKHLWLGTVADNNIDRAKKSRGKVRGSTELSREQVLQMRRIASNLKRNERKLPWGFYTRMGERYGVDEATIWQAVNFVTYRYSAKDSCQCSR